MIKNKLKIQTKNHEKTKRDLNSKWNEMYDTHTWLWLCFESGMFFYNWMTNRIVGKSSIVRNFANLMRFYYVSFIQTTNVDYKKKIISIQMRFNRLQEPEIYGKFIKITVSITQWQFHNSLVTFKRLRIELSDYSVIFVPNETRFLFSALLVDWFT